VQLRLRLADGAGEQLQELAVRSVGGLAAVARAGGAEQRLPRRRRVSRRAARRGARAARAWCSERRKRGVERSVTSCGRVPALAADALAPPDAGAAAAAAAGAGASSAASPAATRPAAGQVPSSVAPSIGTASMGTGGETRRARTKVAAPIGTVRGAGRVPLERTCVMTRSAYVSRGAHK
jgi:hypothetical protein